MTFGLGRLGASFGKLGAGNSPSSPAFSLTAPVLTWDGETFDSTPDFDIATIGVTVGDEYTLEWSTSATTNPDGSFVTQTGVATSTVIAGPTLPAFTVSALANGTYYFHTMYTRGVDDSAWSNAETVTIALAEVQFIGASTYQLLFAA